jgi:hypothetical protein
MDHSTNATWTSLREAGGRRQHSIPQTPIQLHQESVEQVLGKQPISTETGQGVEGGGEWSRLGFKTFP